MSTPAQEKGIIVNVTRLKISNKEHARYGDGLIYILTEDDGTRLPFFKSECGTISCECFFVNDFSIIPDTPRVAIAVDIPALPVAPALTLAKAPLPVVPPAPVVYTELQQKAINTFQAMYDAAVKHREGSESALNGDYGICDNIDRFARAAGSSETPMSEVKENLIRKTAMYSGNYTYPVPCPDGTDAGNAFSRHSNKWRGPYGLNRLVQLEQLIELIKTQWDDSLVNRKTPAFRNGLQVGDIVRYTRRDTPSFWVFRRDDESMSPSFHKLTDKDDYTDIDLNYIVKVDKETVFKTRTVTEFLSELEAQAKVKQDIERQIAELQKALQTVQTDIAMLDYGLADQHKVKRI